MCDSDALARFDAVARAELKPYFNVIGDVIYSANATLVKNDVIFWGFNPGGDPDICDPVGLFPPVQMTLSKALEEFPKRTNSMLNEAWPHNRKGEGGVMNTETGLRYKDFYPKGHAPYQLRTNYLLKKVGRPDALVSNFLFQQTRKAEEVNDICDIDRLVKACWRVHMEIFAIAKPKVLITSAEVLNWMRKRKYKLMKLTKTDREGCKAGHQEWRCEEYHGEFNAEDTKLLPSDLCKLTIIKVPHMALWPIRDEDDNEVRGSAVDWVVTAVKDAVKA
jgi:hypothetical protein